MKLFDVLANIIAGVLVWAVVTGLVYFFVSWGSDEAPGNVPFWPWKAIILRHYWKKLDH